MLWSRKSLSMGPIWFLFPFCEHTSKCRGSRTNHISMENQNTATNPSRSLLFPCFSVKLEVVVNLEEETFSTGQHRALRQRILQYFLHVLGHRPVSSWLVCKQKYKYSGWMGLWLILNHEIIFAFKHETREATKVLRQLLHFSIY